jgi:hypothetical protein
MLFPLVLPRGWPEVSMLLEMPYQQIFVFLLWREILLKSWQSNSVVNFERSPLGTSHLMTSLTAKCPEDHCVNRRKELLQTLPGLQLN